MGERMRGRSDLDGGDAAGVGVAAGAGGGGAELVTGWSWDTGGGGVPYIWYGAWVTICDAGATGGGAKASFFLIVSS